MSEAQIKNLEQLLELDLSKNKKIIQQKITRLTTPGENYASLIYAINITLKTPDGEEEISAVAKTVPTNVVIQKIFRTDLTFKIEINFYKIIIPLLHEFQKEHGVTEVVDFGAKFLGGRVSLNKESDTVDNDAVLLLENLNVKNYTNLDRFHGVDLDAAKLIIKDLAHLHALPIAIKMKKPEVFEREIKMFLRSSIYNVSDAFDFGHFKNKILGSINKAEGCAPYLDRINKGLDKSFFTPSREFFSTISHNDCWVNNTMFKLENGKPVKSKIVDFQMLSYASLAKDLIFFLFTSVNIKILSQYYDELIKFYFDTFISVLQELKCDIQRFTFEAFLDELGYEAKNGQFSHCLWITLPMLQPKGTVKDVSEMSFRDMGKFDITDLHKEKLTFIVEEFARRNWI